jgi:TolB-like protein/Tfp pilus assembly protein PilF
MAIWSAEIKEIERLQESLRGEFPELEKELQYLIKTDDENVALLYSRRCLEVIITDLCECELKRSRGTEPLKGIIDKLQKEEKVPAHIIASMHGLNTLSTFGTHPKDFDPEQVKPVLNNLAIIVKWYLRHKDPLTYGKFKAEEEKFETDPDKIPSPITNRPKRSILVLISIFLTVVIIVVTILGKFDVVSLGSLTKNSKSIAVLPFTNLSNDPEQEYFSIGMVDEILDKLFKVGDLKVIARTSSERFKNTSLSLREIAHKLGVASIMEGSVRKIGNNIKITVQLIDARTEAHMWSEIYEKDISDIFLIQSEVAQAVARELKAVITPETKQLIDKRPTTNMEAYEAYQKGMLCYSKLGKNDLETAMHYFELAIEKDPEFALAYAGIGRVWRGREQMGIISPSEATPRAEAAIMKALELDSTYSEIYHALGGLMTWSKWDWKAGEASFRKALELNPKNADAHSTFSHLLNILGRPDEAMKHIGTAQELDPFNPKIKSFYGVDLMFLHRYDDAVKAFREALDLNPTQGVADANIVDALSLAGREKEAMEMQRNRWKNNSEYSRVLEEGYAEAGFKGGCKKLADFRADKFNTTYSNPISISNLYSMAGDTSNAILWLEKAYEEHNPNIPYLLSPIYDKLRDNSRFQELARKMNLPYK